MIGLLPDIREYYYEQLGNGSLAGAFLALVESDALKNMNVIANKPDVIELNMHKEFQEYYTDALFYLI